MEKKWRHTGFSNIYHKTTGIHKWLLIDNVLTLNLFLLLLHWRNTATYRYITPPPSRQVSRSRPRPLPWRHCCNMWAKEAPKGSGAQACPHREPRARSRCLFSGCRGLTGGFCTSELAYPGWSLSQSDRSLKGLGCTFTNSIILPLRNVSDLIQKERGWNCHLVTKLQPGIFDQVESVMYDWQWM